MKTLSTTYLKPASTQRCMANYLIILAWALGLGSCKKFLDIPPPTSQLVTESVFNNNASASSAVTEIYTKLFTTGESPNYAINNGQLADELRPNVTSGTSYEYYTNAMNNSATGYGGWNGDYQEIYRANAVIAGLQQYAGTSAAVKQQLLGEAYFIRAFFHFYLTNQYGPIPIVLSTDYSVSNQLPRSSRVQVLHQVVNDLQNANNLLNDNYVDATDTIVTTNRVRPNKAAAEALLARACLYLGDYENNNASDYQNAVTAASSVIANSAYKLCTNLSGANSVFLANSTEAIWQLYTPSGQTVNTYDGNYFILLAAPNTSGGSGGNVVSSQLMNAFEAGDKRKTNWIGSVTVNGTIYNFPYKYKVQTGGTTITEFTMVLRLAEQYLIRAEANIELGNTALALADLNIIRTRAGLANYAGATDKPSLLTAIQHERQVELFTEWGHRWFDLNRAVNTASTVNVNTVLGSPGNVCQAKGGVWSSDGHQSLYPIPLADIQKDINLTQNPGY